MKIFEQKHEDINDKISNIKLYENCNQLMLDRFIQIIVEGDLRLLIIEGEPSNEILKETWEYIYAEYTSLINDDNSTEIYKAIRDINMWKMKFQRIEMFISLLSQRPYPLLIIELKKMNYNYAFNHNDVQSYKADLHAVYNTAKTLLIQISNREKDLERLQKQDIQNNKKEKPIDQFDMMLISLSEHYKYEVQPHHLTVARFAKMMNRVKEYAKKLKENIDAQGKEAKKWPRN